MTEFEWAIHEILSTDEVVICFDVINGLQSPLKQRVQAVDCMVSIMFVTKVGKNKANQLSVQSINARQWRSTINQYKYWKKQGSKMMVKSIGRGGMWTNNMKTNKLHALINAAVKPYDDFPLRPQKTRKIWEKQDKQDR